MSVASQCTWLYSSRCRITNLLTGRITMSVDPSKYVYNNCEDNYSFTLHDHWWYSYRQGVVYLWWRPPPPHTHTHLTEFLSGDSLPPHIVAQIEEEKERDKREKERQEYEKSLCKVRPLTSSWNIQPLSLFQPCISCTLHIATDARVIVLYCRWSTCTISVQLYYRWTVMTECSD